MLGFARETEGERKGEVTAKEDSGGKERERGEPEGRERVKNKKEEGRWGWGRDGIQHCPEGFSVCHAFAEFLSLPPFLPAAHPP